jgi:hypothetical protein
MHRFRDAVERTGKISGLAAVIFQRVAYLLQGGRDQTLLDAFDGFGFKARETHFQACFLTRHGFMQFLFHVGAHLVGADLRIAQYLFGFGQPMRIFCLYSSKTALRFFVQCLRLRPDARGSIGARIQ